jgi:hypothetical protein
MRNNKSKQKGHWSEAAFVLFVLLIATWLLTCTVKVVRLQMKDTPDTSHLQD